MPEITQSYVKNFILKEFQNKRISWSKDIETAILFLTAIIFLVSIMIGGFTWHANKNFDEKAKGFNEKAKELKAEAKKDQQASNDKVDKKIKEFDKTIRVC